MRKKPITGIINRIALDMDVHTSHLINPRFAKSNIIDCKHARGVLSNTAHMRFCQSPSATRWDLACQHGNGNGNCHYGDCQHHTCRGHTLFQMFSDDGFEHTQIRNRHRLDSIDHSVSPFQLPSEHFLLFLPRAEWGGTPPNRSASWRCLITLWHLAIEWKRRFIRSS